MAAVQTRQPFGVLDSSRLQKLTSVKNCQNAISASVSSPPSKQSIVSPGKRRLSVTAFDESEDSENVDPAIFNSPSKRSKNFDGAPVKPSRFILNPKSPMKSTTSVQKPLSLSVPTTTTTTPISASRGSPKHKRVGLLSKGRRASSSPFRRINPPSFSTPIGGLPFSIDEALKGSIPGYTAKVPTPEAVVEPVAPVLDVLPDTHMPKSWFFEIHEDTPEQEASNLMEHSASVLDISSDDDAVTKRRDEEREKGKENIPPPEHLVGLPAGNSTTASSSLQQDAQLPTKATSTARGKRAAHPDAMLEDRQALGELAPEDFYAAVPEPSAKVDVVSEVTSTLKPSALSKEFDFAIPSPKRKLEAAREEESTAENVDAQSKEIFICEDEL